MNRSNIILAFILSVTVLSCADKPTEDSSSNLISSAINPNGDSELALLMREMFEEGERIKAQIENGETPSGLKKFETIHSAIPTDEDASGPVFEALATGYLNALKNIEEGDSTTVFRFNNMVDKCMNCHTEFCPGPKVRIKKLYIE